jgi:hypothetical protein
MYSRNLSLLKPIPAAINVLLLLLCLASPALAQTKGNHVKQLETERTRLTKLTNPTDRAESLMKIANVTLTLANDAITANDLAGFTSSVEEYRQTVTDARDTMMDSGLDAYKQPKGYQTIELATRSHLRILKDFSRRLSAADRQPLEEVIELVSKIRDEIVHVLFS